MKSYKFQIGDRVRARTGTNHMIGMVTCRMTRRSALLNIAPVEVIWENLYPYCWYSDDYLMLIPTAIDKLDEIL